MKKFTMLMAAAAVALSASAADWYLHTNILGNSNWQSVKLTQNGDWYEYSSDSFVKGKFVLKCVDNGTETYTGKGATVSEANKEYTYSDNGNDSNSELEGKFTFRANPSRNIVMMEPYEGEIDQTVTYMLRGTIVNGGAEWQDTPLVEGENGVWSLTKDFVVGDFGIKKDVNGVEKDWFKYVNLGDPKDNCEKIESNGNIRLTVAGNYTISFDPATSTITVKQNGGEEPPVVDPTERTLYLVGGDMTGWAENATTYPFSKEGNVYKLTVESLTGEWKIYDGTWGWSFGQGASFDMGVEGDAWFDSQTNFSLNSTKPVTITFTLVEGSDVKGSSIPSKILVKESESTGVAAVEAANGEAVYFNMQGVRVANPENGLFIRVQNGKAVKVVK